jgi:beta-lactamase regulating signal transducer with metallopeptidase domain
MNAASLHTTWLAVSTQALGWTLLHFVWQGAAIALVLWIFFRLARNAAPQVRYVAGCAALALMCTAVLATLVAETRAVWQEAANSSTLSAGILFRAAQGSLHAENAAPEFQAASSSFARVSTDVVASTSSSVTITPSPAGQSSVINVGLLNSLPRAVGRISQRVEPYLPWIVCCWALGVVVFSLRLLADWKTVGALRLATDATDSQWISRFERLKARLGILYPVRLVFSTTAKVPMVIGWLKPVVLVPAGLVTGLTSAQLEAILAHELVHIRRHDSLVNLLQNVVETLFFYHPAVAWVSSQIRIEREHCCDDTASLACDSTLDYARALAALAELRRGPVLGLAANGGSLVERIRRLVAATQTDERRGMSSGAATLLSLTVSVIALAAFGAAVAQQQAVTERATDPNRGVISPARPVLTKSTAFSTESSTTADDGIAVRGKVLRPDGSPAAGAKVVLTVLGTARHKWTLATTSAGPGGEFTLWIAALKRENGRPWIAWLTAQAAGCGLQWATVDEFKGNPIEPVLLKLAPEVPVHGRIVDLEGRPVRDVRVKVFSQRAAGIGGGSVPTLDDDVQPSVRTDADGRFVLGGIGADRVAGVDIRGETVAYAKFQVDTRKNRTTPLRRGFADRIPIFGPDFTFEAAPTRPIVGTVRDADTGQPLAGFTVESSIIAGMLGTDPAGGLRTVTDVRGRYRLVGLPKGSGRGRAASNQIAAVPNAEQPYFIQFVEVPDTPGLAPVTLDITMKRGVWITGRVTDKMTGKPVPSRVMYFPFRANPFAKDRPEFTRINARPGDLDRSATRPDGSFRIVGLPGRGIVAADALPSVRPTPLALSGSYVRGVGASKIAGMTADGKFPTYGFPSKANAKIDNALAEINPAPGTQSVVCDFVLDPGGTLRIHLVDGKGQPVDRCRVSYGEVGRGSLVGEAPQSTFELTGLAPHESRALLIWQDDRKIGKVLTVRYGDNSPRLLTVTLEPCATVKGRLVDEDGIPATDTRITVVARQGTDFPMLYARQFNCDSEGRFVYARLAPGSGDYSLRARGRKIGMTVVADKLAVVPGQVIDLGDVTLKRRNFE